MRRGLRVMMLGVGLAVFTLVGATGASAQEPAKPVLTLDGEAAMVTILIKPDKTADFEAVIAKYREAFEKSDKAERKQQLAGLKFFKSSQQAQGNAIYLHHCRSGREGSGVRHHPGGQRGVPERGSGHLREVQGLLRRSRDRPAQQGQVSLAVRRRARGHACCPRGMLTL